MRAVRAFVAAAFMLAGGGSATHAQKPAALKPASQNTVQTAAAATSGSHTLDKADLDSWLDGFLPYALRSSGIPGAVVVVVKDGQILTRRGFGYADVANRKPVDPDRTLFRPGSVSKLITWTAVMQQVEEGRIDLDADVNRYLDFKIPPKNDQPMTMRQLMTHTAGFEETGKNMTAKNAKDIKSLRDYLISSMPQRIFTPGTTPSYSNYGTALAGYIVERVARMPFNDYVEQRIFAPLGMTRSTFRAPLPARLAPWMANGYEFGSADPQKFEIINVTPAGNLSAPGTDMARFMLAHLQGGELDGKRILKPETARMMHDTPNTILPRINRMELGFCESNLNGRRVISHGGDTLLFHSVLHLFPDDGIGIFLSVNSGGRENASSLIRTALLNDFTDRYFPDSQAPDRRVPVKVAVEHARMMAGNWESSRRSETGFWRAAGLSNQFVIKAGENGNLIMPNLKREDGTPQKWVEIEPYLWRAVGEKTRIAAQVVDGRIIRWGSDGSPFAVYNRADASRNAAWLIPLVCVSLAIMLLTLLHWPVAALVRRHYKVSLPLTGSARSVYRGMRASAGLVLAVVIGWLISLTMLAALGMMSDGVLWLLQLAGLAAFGAAVIFGVWNLWLAWRAPRSWTSRIGAMAFAIAAMSILYFVSIGGLLDMTVKW